MQDTGSNLGAEFFPQSGVSVVIMMTLPVWIAAQSTLARR
jgi:hypothetical protein